MADNKNAIEANGKQKRMSVDISTLFSQSDTTDRLRITLWGGRVGFEFSRSLGKSSNDTQRCFITFDYEQSIVISNLIVEIIRDRVIAHREGKEYPQFDIPIETSYIKDGEKHITGSLNIASRPTTISQVGNIGNRIALTYTQGTEKYEVVLASRLVSQQVKDKFTLARIDPYDARLGLFGKTLEGIVNNLPIIAYINKLIDVMMGNTTNGTVSSGGKTKRIGSPNPAGLSTAPAGDMEEIDFG